MGSRPRSSGALHQMHLYVFCIFGTRVFIFVSSQKTPVKHIHIFFESWNDVKFKVINQIISASRDIIIKNMSYSVRTTGSSNSTGQFLTDKKDMRGKLVWKIHKILIVIFCDNQNMVFIDRIFANDSKAKPIVVNYDFLIFEIAEDTIFVPRMT